ncbi:hypothetical protein MVEN_02317300 [Mycena venus]|uniref:Uncharacterized protein n=1 Tax=Mycena venus TaxID=2733690 RepID=A0A8H6X4R6_9AGAR|nr:hypothetical protein MVEN_02317300 [Mycena venus]
MSSSDFTAKAVLENPRRIPKSKMIVFDAQVFLGSSKPAIICSLRLFNDANNEFAKIGCYVVVVHPACTTPTLKVYSQELTPIDFQIFGDIVWMNYIGSHENFDLRQHTIVHVAGPATNVNRDDATFEIHAGQYLSATKNADNVFPVQCLFPNTKRWESYKPIPGKGKPVLIEGLVTGVERNDSRTVKYFIVDLLKVTF